MEKRRRMVERDKEPSEEEILRYIGKKASKAWAEIKDYLAENYDFTPEISFWGEKYGWTIRYRKSGKTLTALYPEEGGFTIQIILGKKEVEKFQASRDEFSPEIRDLFDVTKQLHDGRWLWISQPEMGNMDDIKGLLEIKRKPKKKTNS